MSKANYFNTSRQDRLDEKCIYDIAAICNLPQETVIQVFDAYKLYILHQVATAPKPKHIIDISLPCFSTFRLAETIRKDGKKHLRISVHPYIKEKLRTEFDSAFYEDEDALLIYYGKYLDSAVWNRSRS